MPYGVLWNAGLWDMVALPTQPEASKLSGKPRAHMYQKNCVQFRGLGTAYDLLYHGRTVRHLIPLNLIFTLLVWLFVFSLCVWICVCMHKHT